MQTVVNGLKGQYGAQVRFADLDYYDSKNRPLVQQFQVRGHPTFVLVDGQANIVKRWVGIAAQAEIESALKQAIAR